MSERAFFEPRAKERTRDAIRAIESTTCAEVVVAVRHRAAWHVRISLLFGAVVALLCLVVMLVSPVVYDVRTIPLDVFAAFVLASGLALWTDAIRRRLSPRSWIDRALREAAAKCFGDSSIARTRDRSGILVFVALLERRVHVLADEGVPASVSADVERIRTALEGAVERRDFDAFVVALAEFSAPLASALPRKADDVNELSDEVA